MGVKFIIDSASDVLPGEAKSMGVTHLPLKVIFGEETYEDAVNLSHREFYEKLIASKELPTTCQIPPADFLDAYEKLVSAGDSVVVMAAADYHGKVFVVDSLSAAVGERILLRRGLELAEQGFDAAAVAAKLDEEKMKVRVVAVLDTLEYLKKGGRISATTALVGTVLSIKPAIKVEDGLVVMAGKARGTRQGNVMLRDLIEGYGGVNFNKPYSLVYSGLNDELLQKFVADCPELWQGRTDMPSACVGCAIGTHVGPGAYGIAFFEK